MISIPFLTFITIVIVSSGIVAAVLLHKAINLKFLLDNKVPLNTYEIIELSIIFLFCGPVGWYFSILYITAFAFYKFNTLMMEGKRL